MSQGERVFAILVSMVVITLITTLLCRAFGPRPEPRCRIRTTSIKSVRTAFSAGKAIRSADARGFATTTNIGMDSIGITINSEIGTKSILTAFSMSSVSNALTGCGDTLSGTGTTCSGTDNAIDSTGDNVGTVSLRVSRARDSVSTLGERVTTARGTSVGGTRGTGGCARRRLRTLHRRLGGNKLARRRVRSVVGSLGGSSNSMSVRGTLSSSITTGRVGLTRTRTRLASLGARHTICRTRASRAISSVCGSIVRRGRGSCRDCGTVCSSLGGN